METPNSGVCDTEIQADNLMTQQREPLVHSHCIDSTATPPSELTKQTELNDKLIENYEFSDLELEVLKDEFLFVDCLSEMNEENVEDHTNRISESEEMISELKAGLSDAKEGQSNEELRFQELINEIELLRKALSEGIVRNKVLQDEIEEKKANIKIKNNEIQILNNNLHETENLLKVNKVSMLKVKKNNEELFEKLNLRSLDSSFKNQQIENLNIALICAENKSTQLLEFIHNLENEVKGKNSMIDMLNLEMMHSEDLYINFIEELKSKNGKLELWNRNLQGEIKELNCKLLERENRSQSEINGASNEVNSALESAELKNKEPQKDFLSLEEEIKELKELKQLKNIKIKNLENKISLKMEEARVEIKKITDKVPSLDAELQHVGNKNKELRKLLADWVGRIDELEESTQSLSESLTEIISFIKVFETEKLNLFHGRIVEAVERQFAEAKKKYVEDCEKIEDIIKLNAEVYEECKSSAKNIKILQEKVSDMEKEVIAVGKGLETEICKLKDDKHALEIEREDLNSKISEISAEYWKMKNMSTF